MTKTTKYTSTIDDRFSNFDGKSVFGNGSTPITSYTNTSPKFVQGVAYLQSNNHLKIDIRSNMRYEYDRVATVIDHDYVSGVDFDYESDGKILITYKNWTKSRASTKTLTLQFISGFKKTIVLQVPGRTSKLNDDVENTTSLFTTSPYENILSLDFSEGKKANNSILGAVIPKKDPYNVFNYLGTYTLNLPFAYYINSSYLNEIFVEQGVTSTNKDVDNGISNRGVGHLYSGRKEQEIHFVNLLTTNTNLSTSQDVLNNLNTAPFTYGFTYASNLYFIADDAQEYQVCIDPGNPSFFLTSGNDCDGTTIGTPYTNKRFVDGHCCNSGCDDFSITVENTSPEQKDITNTNGSILVTVTGGTANYTYVLTKFDATGIGTDVSSGAKAGLTHSFTGLVRHDSNFRPYLITVTDATSCVKTVNLTLQTKVNQQNVGTGACVDTSAANYDNGSYFVVSDSICFFCSEKDNYGNAYNGLTYGDDDNHDRAVGVDFVSNSGSVVGHALSPAGSTGMIQFSGELFPPLADHIASDANEAYKLKLHTLGNHENANNKTKAEILALTATSTVAVNANFTYSFGSLTSGWYAIEAYVEEVPNVANCKSVHRFYVGYSACKNPKASNYDSLALVHKEDTCRYDCLEEAVHIISTTTNNPCVRSLSIARGRYDIINWIIGGERKQGFGPHLAAEGDYIEVMVEDSETQCTQRADMHISETDCSKTVGTARSLIIQQTEGQGGCTDNTAANFNCDAQWDDGSCIAMVFGCTDVMGVNYDPKANVESGQCLYGTIGCSNPQAINYDPLANIVDNDTCIHCESITGSLQLGMVTSFVGAEESTPSLISQIDSGAFNIYDEVQATIKFGITNIGAGSYADYLPSGCKIKLFRLPVSDGTVSGYTSLDFKFPISENMPNMVPDVTYNLTGVDSPIFNNPTFGAWNSDGSVNPVGLLFQFELPGIVGTIGYAQYILELGIPQENGKTCYEYSQRSVPSVNTAQITYDALANPGGFISPSQALGGGSYNVQGPNNFENEYGLGCIYSLASNYTGWGYGNRNIWYGLRNNLNYSPDQFSYYSLSPGIDATIQGVCEYEGFDQPECLPKNKAQKEKYITDCLYNGIGNWYTRLIGGIKDNCEDRDIWIMSFIKYLTTKNGLDCIFNCSDVETADYPEKKTCSELWQLGGNIEWSMLNNTGQGNGSYGNNAYVKMTTQLPWMGEYSSNTIWKVNNNCGTDCGNPYGIGADNWDICIDPKIITETTNYLDNFYKFASNYCKQCSPCSYLVGNSNVVIGSDVDLTEPYDYQNIDNGLQIGGIDIDIDGDNITTNDEGP